MITEAQRESAYLHANTALKEMYSSLETARLIGGIRQKYYLRDDAVVDVVGDIILGLYPKHMLTSLLTEQLGLTWKTAGEIASELGDLLDRIPSAETARDFVHSPQPGSTLPVTLPQAEEPSKPLTRDELMRALDRRQTEGGGIEAMRQKLEQAANQKTVGYGAVERKENTEQDI